MTILKLILSISKSIIFAMKKKWEFLVIKKIRKLNLRILITSKNILLCEKDSENETVLPVPHWMYHMSQKTTQ